MQVESVNTDLHAGRGRDAARHFNTLGTNTYANAQVAADHRSLSPAYETSMTCSIDLQFCPRTKIKVRTEAGLACR